MIMDSLSRNILSVLFPFSVLFSKSSWKKALPLLLGILVCTGKRTVCSALRAMGLCKEAGFSNQGGTNSLVPKRACNFLCHAEGGADGDLAGKFNSREGKNQPFLGKYHAQNGGMGRGHSKTGASGCIN